MASLGLIVGLARGLLSADPNLAGKMLENAGRNALMNLVGGPSSPFGIVLANLLKDDSGPTAGREVSEESLLRKQMRKARLHSRWARAHQEWLSHNRWRFDWRSQPRRPAGNEAGGEWMDGRLGFPVTFHLPVSRKSRQQGARAMKAFRKRRRALGVTRTGNRRILSSWSTSDAN